MVNTALMQYWTYIILTYKLPVTDKVNLNLQYNIYKCYIWVNICVIYGINYYVSVDGSYGHFLSKINEIFKQVQAIL